MDERMYCWNCMRVVYVECPLETPAVYYPHEDAHDDEYGDPQCCTCGSKAVSEYECDDCCNDDNLIPIERINKFGRKESILICEECLEKMEQLKNNFNFLL